MHAPRILHLAGVPRRPFSRYRLPIVLVGALVAACATSHHRAVGAPATSESSLNVVTEAELVREVRGEETLLRALQRLRPLFLRQSRSVPLVSIDGSPPVELSVLETIRVAEVTEVRMLRASSSVSIVGITPNGRVVVGDVILVRLHANRHPFR
jgi:hypothetical protein